MKLPPLRPYACATCLGIAALSASGQSSSQSARLDPLSLPPNAAVAVPSSIAPVRDLYCGDAVSEALYNTSPEMPCWADLRSGDRWNAASLRSGELLRPSENNGMQPHDYNRASITGGFLQADSFVPGSNPHVYGGNVAGALTAGRQRWQFSAEDVAGGAAVRATNANGVAGLNRGTLRLKAELKPRLLLQVRATNTFGSDSYRLFAPLDERVVGHTEAPAPEAAAYGLHNGRVVSEQEDATVNYAASRRTSWNASVDHSLQHYSDFGTTVQTLAARTQVLHALSPAFAVGAFAFAGAQTSTHVAATLPACSLAGGGAIAESRTNRFTLAVSGGVAKATSGCGHALQPVGDAALTVLLGHRSAMYFTAERKLGQGILLTSPLLSTTGVGLRHTFAQGAGFNVGAGGLLGTNPVSHRDSTAVFAEAGVHYRLGKYLMQQTSVRRFENSVVDRAAGGPGGQTTVTFALWVTRRNEGRKDAE